MRTIRKMVASGSFALVAVLGVAWPAQAQDAKAPYPKMAPIGQYMMADRNAEIALARTAAPESISHDAEILVLGRHGYETAVKGTNGFVCLVERGWQAPFDTPDYANPKLRAPNCYNPQAARTILPLTLKRTELALAGLSKAQIIDRMNAFGRKEVPALQPGAMCYMMSKKAYLTDQDGHNLAHLMFYVPQGTAWGENLRGSPVLLLQQDVLGAPSPISLYIIPVRRWSDGTSAVAVAR
ncbi:MAG TPA: hypothetical protein VGR93_08805 [Candidatus Acidoferrales bacterium]|nr:hypothetical protein [Candidatus Acidoferrales bacterium]